MATDAPADPKKLTSEEASSLRKLFLELELARADEQAAAAKRAGIEAQLKRAQIEAMRARGIETLRPVDLATGEIRELPG